MESQADIPREITRPTKTEIGTDPLAAENHEALIKGIIREADARDGAPKRKPGRPKKIVPEKSATFVAPTPIGGKPKGATFRNPRYLQDRADAVDDKYIRNFTRAKAPSVLNEMWELIRDGETPKNTKARLIEVWLEHAFGKPRQQSEDEEGHQPLAVNPLPDAS